MTKESEQFSNRRWFKDMLNRPIQQATASGKAPGSFASSLTDKTKLSRKQFFALSGISLDEAELQFWFEDSAIKKPSLDYLNKFLPAGSTVVGYELSAQTRNILKRAKVHYIDIWLHPIRFYDDVLFGFSSSHPEVYQEMKQFHLGDENFWLYADRLKIQQYKGWQRDEIPLEENSALLVGQTLHDKALNLNGSMLNLLSFKDEIERLAAEHSKLYFSRHPFVKHGDEEVLSWLRSLPNVEITKKPTYHLLAQPGLKKVVAISSSVVHEARFFGKKTEFLYKPVLTFGKRFEKDYITVYQEFISPHFWAAALKPLTAVNECPRVMFAAQKDKLRDMLAFYWGWPTVDKNESVRMKLNVVAARVHASGLEHEKKRESVSAVGQLTAPRLQKGLSSAQFLRLADKQMRSADIVTFDVFDTLIERPFENYEQLFDVLAPEVERRTGLAPARFVELRKKSRTLAEDLRVNEEVSLETRYKAVLRAAGLPTAEAKDLAELEYQADLKVLRARPIGRALVERALASHKRVVLISDIYYSTAQVEQMLKACGYDEFEAVFTSCDEGLLKHSGNLYPHVQKVLGVTHSDSFLHIGDNEQSDFVQATHAGWPALHLPSAAVNFRQRSLVGPSLRFSDAPTESLIRGVISKHFHDVPKAGLAPTWCEGSAYRFGYSIAGTMYLGFAQWVLAEARKAGVAHLYFLARDGDIVKRVYDQLTEGDATAPRSHYLLASRRSVNVANLKSLDDALALLKVNFSPCPVGKLIQSRFGLEAASIPLQALVNCGYGGLSARADFKAHQTQLTSLITELWPIIQANSAQERDCLLEYYRKEGLMGAEPWAIVDIGHNGTMQESLHGLTGKKIAGYYFVTYDGITQLEEKGLPAKGYVAEKLNPKTSTHPYCKRLLMFELLFLNDQGSFVKMTRENNELKPVHLSLEGEHTRVKFIREVYRGALAFTRSLKTLNPGFALNISGDEAIAAFVEMLRSPSAAEARMVEGVSFENVYSGRDARYILAPAGQALDSLWVEARDALVADKSNAPAYAWVTWSLDKVVGTLAGTKKYLKFQQNPRRFCLESRHPVLRWLARFV